MPTLQINAQTVTVAEGATLMVAARQLGIDVPALCWRDGLEHVTSCMLCVVEDCCTGALYPACSRPAVEGMQIATSSESVLAARRTALELLLGDHLGDCEGPCRRACTAGMDIPLMLHHIASGNQKDVIRVIKQHIALPATLGRICPAPCEKICRRGTHNAPVGICLLKRFAADVDLAAPEPYRPAVAGPSGFHVAIAGTGPAGLSAAYALLREGHACTLFEKEHLPGGGLRAPELQGKLPSEVLDAEIAQLALPGLTWRTGVALGETISLDTLKQQFDAVIIAWGEASPEQARALGLEPGLHGVAVDRKTHATNDPQVFACGSAVVAGHLAVRATGQGFATAAAVDQFLRGLPVIGSPRLYDHRIPGALDPAEIAVLLAEADPGPRIVPADGYTADEAFREASRCLHCECRKPQTCLLRQQAEAHAVDPRAWRSPERRRITIERRGGINYEPGKCIACGICVRLSTAAREPLGLTFIGRGFDVRVGVPFHETLDAGLGCVASKCVAACPTGALSGGREDPAGGIPVVNAAETSEGRDAPKGTFYDQSKNV